MAIPNKIPIKKDALEIIIKNVFTKMDLNAQQYQIDVITCDAMRCMILKARGIGITLAMALKLLLLALTVKSEYIVISQDRDSALHVLSYIQDFYEALMGLNYEWNCELVGQGAKNEKRFTNGSFIKSLASTPKGIRGYHGFVYWDEAAFHSDDRELRKAINGCLRPAFPLYVSSTPNELTGEFYNMWQAAKADDKTRWQRFELPFTVCNVPEYQAGVLEEKAEAIKYGLYDDWLQEYACKFIDGSTRLFPWTLIAPAIDDSIPDNIEADYAGIDFGKQVDQSELVIVGRDADKKIRVLKMLDYVLKQEYAIQLESMVEVLRVNKHLAGVFVDKTGVGVKLCEDLENSDIGYLIRGINYDNKMKERMIMYLYTQLCARKLLLPRDDKLLKQLHTLRRSVTEGGMTRYKHEDGKKDDRVWALAMALQGYATQGQFSVNDADIQTAGRAKTKTTVSRLQQLRDATRGLM